MDARALALAAVWLAEGRHVHGAYPHNSDHEEAVSNLRLLVNAHARQKKATTRLLNQLDALAHSIWPALAAKKELWLRAVAAGAVTPAELHALARDPGLCHVEGFTHGNSRRALERLADAVPPHVQVSPATVEAVQSLHAQHTVITAELAALDEKIEHAVLLPPFDEITTRWLTVPGAASLAIATLHVACRGRATLYDRDQFKASVGAHPRTSRSAAISVHPGKKAGYRPAMVQMWFWTMRLLKPTIRPNPVRAYYARLEARHHQHSFRAAVGKLARVLHGVAGSPGGYVFD